MKINKSGATYSKITAIGEKIKKLESESGKDYLYLNQGVNAVCNINLTEVVKHINFNSKDIQVYPAMKGRPILKQAINKDYFLGKSDQKNLIITGGGMSGLDLVFQTILVDKFYLPAYFWGSYMNIITSRNLQGDYYENLTEIENNIDNYKNSAVVICDPNNPIGDKFDDNKLIKLIKELNRAGAIVIIDSPYRKVFYNDDDFYTEVGLLENVIIVESFSKAIGLSGQRIGFVHSVNTDLMTELAIRLMYSTNGINGFAQLLVEKILTTTEGKKATADFKEKTTKDIKKNIEFLKSKGLIANEFYTDTEPKGIFTIVNLSEEELLKHRIASVSLSFFTRKYKEKASAYSRICVSVPHYELVQFFNF